jgi:predicted nucleotidyltransferase
VGNDFNNDSDIDFLYTIDIENFPGWDKGQYDYTDNILSFENGLKKLLKRKIDLIPDLPIQNKYFKASVDATKKLIYAA